MHVEKWSQDLKYKNNVSKQERKEKIHNILTTSLKKNLKISTLSLRKMSNSSFKYDYFHIQNYFPFLSRMTNGKSVQ